MNVLSDVFTNAAFLRDEVDCSGRGVHAENTIRPREGAAEEAKRTARCS